MKRGICVLDTDNLFPARRGWRNTKVDLQRLAKSLIAAGIGKTTAFAHETDDEEVKEWARFNIRLVSRNANVDPFVALSATNDLLLHWRLSSKIVPTLIVGSGDHFFCKLVAAARAAGTEVHVWARQKSASAGLLELADRVRFVDDMVVRAPRLAHQDAQTPGLKFHYSAPLSMG